MKIIFLLILSILLSGCSVTSPTVVNHGIPNLRCVDARNNIWRGGQPNQQGFDWLKQQGIQQIIKLNEEKEGSDFYALYTNKITVTHAEISLWQQLGWEKFPDKAFSKTLSVMSSSNVFIHCEHGQDRTGLFVGCYRVKIEGWSKPTAEREMLSYGFHKELLGLWYQWEILK